jgi:hypothetical protein
MKICKQCGIEKTLDDFYKLSKARSNKGDGHDYRCKECVKNYMHSEKQLVMARARDAIRRTSPEYIDKKAKREKIYAATDQGKLTHKKAQRKYHQTEYGQTKTRERCKKFRQTEKYKAAVERHHLKYPERRSANLAVMNAIHSGKLKRPTVCSVCDKACAPHGHHPDYSKPLEVIWMCQKCHVALHWSAI